MGRCAAPEWRRHGGEWPGAEVMPRRIIGQYESEKYDQTKKAGAEKDPCQRPAVERVHEEQNDQRGFDDGNSKGEGRVPRRAEVDKGNGGRRRGQHEQGDKDQNVIANHLFRVHQWRPTR